MRPTGGFPTIGAENLFLTNKDWLAVSKSSQLRALDVSVIFSSALFWSWLALSAVFPVFPGLSQIEDGVMLFRAASFGGASLVLLLSALLPQHFTQLLNSRKWEIGACVVSVGGAVCALGGANLAHAPLVATGAVLIGFTFPYFMLEWCRMYSRRGVRTAAPLIAGSFAVSFLADGLILAIAPSERALLIIALPLIITATLYGVQALIRSAQRSEAAEPMRVDPSIAIGATKLMTTDPEAPSELEAPNRTEEKRQHERPLLFTAALLLGLALGFLLGINPTANIDGPATLLVCAATAFAVFALACLKPMLYRIVIHVLLSLGVAGLIFASSSLGGPLLLRDVLYAAMLVGLLSFFFYLWSLTSFYATYEKDQIISLFSLCLLAVCCGFLASTVLFLLTAVPLPYQLGYLVAALLFTIGTTFLATCGSTPIDLFRSSASFDALANSESAAGHTEALALFVAKRHGLTGREQEILELLLIGRSRPRIAESLCVSENTINSHIQHIYRKVGVHGLQELLDYVYQNAPREP